MNPRIAAIDPAHAETEAKELLTAVQAKLGLTPNLMRTLAHSPAALKGYLSLNSALAGGVLPAQVREQLALAIAQENGCDYCVAAHSLLGKLAGLAPAQLLAARHGKGEEGKSQAILDVASTLLRSRGNLTDAQFAAARGAGISDAELAEIVGHVALNVLTNYFNVLARTVVDFPPVPLAL